MVPGLSLICLGVSSKPVAGKQTYRYMPRGRFCCLFMPRPLVIELSLGLYGGVYF